MEGWLVDAALLHRGCAGPCGVKVLMGGWGLIVRGGHATSSFLMEGYDVLMCRIWGGGHGTAWCAASVQGLCCVEPSLLAICCTGQSFAVGNRKDGHL